MLGEITIGFDGVGAGEPVVFVLERTADFDAVLRDFLDGLPPACLPSGVEVDGDASTGRRTLAHPRPDRG